MVGTPDFYDQVSVNNQLEIPTNRILGFPILSIQFYFLSEIPFPGLVDYGHILSFGNNSLIFLIVITFLFRFILPFHLED